MDVTDGTRKVYCGMLRCIDVAVEDLMVALHENYYYDNTLVIFAGDNGGQYIVHYNTAPPFPKMGPHKNVICDVRCIPA